MFYLLIIIAVGGWYYLKPKTSPGQSAKVEQPAVPADTLVIEMNGDKYRFNPDSITVKKGQSVRITLTSVDMPHNFVVDELEVQGAIVKPGQTGSVEFTAAKTGDFEFYCSVGNHRQMGMVGKLKVAE